MKNILYKICSLVLLLLLTAGLTACNGSQNTTNEDLNQPATSQPNDDTTPDITQPPDPIQTQDPPPNQSRQYTLDELGQTIVAAGEFWNKWWASHHTFEWEHIDDSRRNWQPWDEEITPAHHPLSRGFAIILPSAGFTSLDDVGAYLSQFYTQAWVDTWADVGVFADPIVSIHEADGTIVQLFGIGGFEEYDGELFVFIQTEWTARPDWGTATHTLIEQDGNHAVVETIVSTHIHGYYPSYEMPTITYHFTLIDGRIDSGYGQLTWPETDTSQSQERRGHTY